MTLLAHYTCYFGAPLGSKCYFGRTVENAQYFLFLVKFVRTYKEAFIIHFQAKCL